MVLKIRLDQPIQLRTRHQFDLIKPLKTVKIGNQDKKRFFDHTGF